jgi:hypothetical protein
MERKKYASPAAMRIALEERINRNARESDQDIARLRRQVAFDRLLARIFSGPLSNRMVLKGGYAIELRLHKARTTKDIGGSTEILARSVYKIGGRGGHARRSILCNQ